MFERLSYPYKYYLSKVWTATYKNEEKALRPNDKESTQKKL